MWNKREPFDQISVEEADADPQLRDHALLERVVLGLEGAGNTVMVHAGEGAVQELVDLPHPAPVHVKLPGQVVRTSFLEQGLVIL